MEDLNIITQLQNRKESGLSNLYDKYAAALNGIIYRIIKDKSIAEEILSNTMLKAWNKIDTYDVEKSSLFTWLATIARNSAIDKSRLKSFQNHNKTESITDHVYKIGYTTDQSKLDADRVIKLVDEKYRVVLEKMYLEGYSQSDISKELDIPLGTVKTRLRKAIQILRKELGTEKSTFYGLIIFFILLILKLL